MSENLTTGRRVALWGAINKYAVACGGDPSRRVYSNTARQLAVAEVERISGIEDAADTETAKRIIFDCLSIIGIKALPEEAEARLVDAADFLRDMLKANKAFQS